MIITIDGPAGTGKSTVAKQVAGKLGFVFFDTGAMYRAVTYCILKDKISLEDSLEVDNLLRDFPFRITEEKGQKRYWVDGREVTKEIRTPEVTNFVSQVSALPSVRRSLIGIQRHFAQSINAVFEGRDMGSAVFPDAEVKIYLDASAEIRAERRFLELKQKSEEKGAVNLTKAQVLKELLARDSIDSSRECNPLIVPSDAYVIDTSYLSIGEVVNKILEKVQRL